jgi:predicted nucleic acid-binding protein
MDRLFLDANVLFSAAYRPNAGLHQFWKLKNVILCSSHYALGEARINLAHEVQRRRLARLARSIQLCAAGSIPPFCSMTTAINGFT